MHRIARTIVSAALALFFVSPALAAGVETMPREWHYQQQPGKADRDSTWSKVTRLVGQQAKEIQLGDWRGAETSLQANRGKVVVLDFWATWCGPCIRSIPHNNELANKYKDNLAIIAICAPRGGETMHKVADQHKVEYPTALDPGSQASANYGVQWFPYYVIIDQQGVIRATGIMPSYVEQAVELLLQEGKAANKGKPKTARNKAESESTGVSVSPSLAKHLEGSTQRRKQLNALHNNTPPAITATNWINTESLALEDLKGSVVVLDFWATWCGPCKRAVPHTNELQAKYKDQGLVIIGACHSRGAEKMPDTVEQLGIEYPVFADVDGKTVNAYRADGFPDYYVIGRDGNVFAADVKNKNVEAVIKLALAQPAPKS